MLCYSSTKSAKLVQIGRKLAGASTIWPQLVLIGPNQMMKAVVIRHDRHEWAALIWSNLSQ